MFCKKCGCEIEEGVCFCKECGEPVFERGVVKEELNKKNNWGIAALIFSVPPFVGCCGLGLGGFILAILGLKFAKKHQGVGHNISFAALLISCFWMAIWVFAIAFSLLMAFVYGGE